MSLQSITIGGRHGTVVYLNDNWEEVPEARATMARALFEDGSSAFYQVTQRRAARRRRPETAVHAAGDAHFATMKVTVDYAFATARAAIRGMAGRQPKEIADAAAKAVKKALGEVLPKQIRAVMAAGGEAAVGMLGDQSIRAAAAPKFKMRFDAASPEAVAWADRHAAELIDGISETTREDINNAIAEALERGDLRDAYDEILAAVGDSDRAELIARTEIMTAAHEGQRQAWDQAIEAGLLPKNVRRMWVATGDESVCPICEQLDGEIADLDGEYSDPGGDGPPAHPNCRCTEGIV